jgi:hypothetical protein
MMVFHPDKVQKDPKLKKIAEKRSKEINVAKDELVAHLNQQNQSGKQNRITINGGEGYGKVSDFFREVCHIERNGGSYHLDVYWAYRLWCTDNGLFAVSIDDLDRALDSMKLVANRRNINGVESVYWLGLEVVNPKYLISEEFWDYDPFVDGMPKQFPEAKEYADVDDDDDLSEVVF